MIIKIINRGNCLYKTCKFATVIDYFKSSLALEVENPWRKSLCCHNHATSGWKIGLCVVLNLQVDSFARL
jgi:hypothetical protein